MKLDARVRYTKMVIKDSLVKLLEKKPLNKITVKEICELAEINRATFYKYYYDVFDLMEQLKKEAISELQQFIQPSKLHKISDILEQLLKKIKEEGTLYITLFSGHGDNTFPTQLFDICYEKSKLSIETDFPKFSETKQKWVYYFLAYGCNGILNSWIDNGMKENPSEVAIFVEELFSKILNMTN